MPEPTPTPRRWFKWSWLTFSLRTLFVVVTVLAVFIAYHVNWIRQRNEFIARERAAAEAREVPVAFDGPGDETRHPPPPVFLRAFLVQGYSVMFVIAEGSTEAALTADDWERLREARRLFPEAGIVAVHYVLNEGDGTFTCTLSLPDLN